MGNASTVGGSDGFCIVGAQHSGLKLALKGYPWAII
jgi:hypothetical protein